MLRSSKPVLPSSKEKPPLPKFAMACLKSAAAARSRLLFGRIRLSIDPDQSARLSGLLGRKLVGTPHRSTTI